MQKKIEFGVWEAVTVIINVVCTKIFLNFPRKMTEEAGTAGWLLTIYIAVIAFLAFMIIVKLYKKFERKDLLDIGEHIAGGFGRILVGLVMILFLGFLVSIYLREFTENMKIITFTASPLSYVMVFFMLGMVVSAYLGIETTVRYHAIAVPLIASGFLIILIGVIPHMELNRVTPILGYGAKQIFWNGIPKVSVYGELILLFLLIPYLKSHQNFKKAGWISLGFSSFFLISAVFVFLTVVEYPIALESFLPIHRLATMINYGRFIQRIESVFVLIWAAAGLLYLSVGFYFMVYLFQKTFKLAYYKPLIIPFAVLVFNTAFLPANLMTAVELDTFYYSNYAWLITFLFTALLLLVAGMIKKKKEKNQ